MAGRFSDHLPPIIARKFLSIIRPSCVKILSGWNWTPSTTYSLWRMPMITPFPPFGPFAIQEDTSRHSGRVGYVPASEWYLVTGRSCGRDAYTPLESCLRGEVLPWRISPVTSTSPPKAEMMHCCPMQTPRTGILPLK